jgi:hypothetical protein
MKTSLRAALILAGLLTVSRAFAGGTTVWPVNIDSARHLAQGAVPSAVRSWDVNQTIECQTYTTVSGASASYWSYCYAYDPVGNFASCYSGSEAIAATIRGINSDSGVIFVWDASGTCTQLSVVQGSAYEPRP